MESPRILTSPIDSGTFFPVTIAGPQHFQSNGDEIPAVDLGNYLLQARASINPDPDSTNSIPDKDIPNNELYMGAILTDLIEAWGPNSTLPTHYHQTVFRYRHNIFAITKPLDVKEAVNIPQLGDTRTLNPSLPNDQFDAWMFRTAKDLEQKFGAPYEEKRDQNRVFIQKFLQGDRSTPSHWIAACHYCGHPFCKERKQCMGPRVVLDLSFAIWAVNNRFTSPFPESYQNFVSESTLAMQTQELKYISNGYYQLLKVFGRGDSSIFQGDAMEPIFSGLQLCSGYRSTFGSMGSS
ncbi:hypothetical protein TWF173_002057 [Orbilia oligospora]|nr:hypothetical protein TWF173_002057 [Orbilia oligospora]